jgi:hypothetical protein
VSKLTIVLLIGILIAMVPVMVSAEIVTPALSYQGKLTDSSGTPLSGSQSVIFTIYDAPTGGNIITTSSQTITVQNGLFTTTIPISDPSKIDGRALYLEIRVNGQTLSPREPILPVAYAMGLRPDVVGASFTTSRAGTSQNWLPAVNISTAGIYNPGIKINTSSDMSPGVIAFTYGDYSRGADIYTFGDSSHGVWAVTKGDESIGLIVDTSGTWSPGVRVFTEGQSSQGVYALTQGEGSAGVVASTTNRSSDGVSAYVSGPNSRAIVGESVQDVGVYGKGKTGGFFTTNQEGYHASHEGLAGVTVETGYRYNPGVFIRTYSDDSDGVRSITFGNYSTGVFGWTDGDGSMGVFGRADGPNSPGVGANTLGSMSDGVHAVAYGPSSRGVYAFSQYDIGVYGKGKVGGHFTTNVAGIASAPLAGVNVSTAYTYNRGVQSFTAGSHSDGVYASTTGPSSNGIVAYAHGDSSAGLFAQATGVGGRGATLLSTQAEAIYADSGAADGISIKTPDYISARGSKFPASDVAEYMPVADTVDPGTVMVIGKGGMLQPSTIPNDTHVAGIVSTAPAVFLGAHDDGNPGEALIAVAGRVPCKVDASYGAIAEGDLLTTSSTPGYAMKAEPIDVGGVEIYRPGTILGKAMGSLESGTGTIKVIVTLQ